MTLLGSARDSATLLAGQCAVSAPTHNMVLKRTGLTVTAFAFAKPAPAAAGRLTRCYVQLMLNYDDPAVEEQWCDERRAQVVSYLDGRAVEHGRVGDWPAWHVAPHVSIWAIESLKAPGWVGWWVICGDLPTDYVSASSIRHPRDAVRAIAQRSRELIAYMERGEQPPEMSVGSPDSRAELTPLLRTRAELLASWAEDDSVWSD